MNEKYGDRYLDIAVSSYKDFVKDGDIIPLEFKFASFDITKEKFNHYAIDALSERIRIGVDSGEYDLQSFSREITYDDLVDYSSRKKLNLTTYTEDKTTGVLIDKVLPGKVAKDLSIVGNDIRNATLNNACVRTMEFKMQELINFNYFNPVLDDGLLRSENQANSSMLGTAERIDFVATLVAMKEVLPKVYRQVMVTLTEREDLARSYLQAYTTETNLDKQKQMEQSASLNLQIVNLTRGLKSEVSNPSDTVLKRVLKVDNSLQNAMIDKYPQTMKEVFANNNSKKTLKYN